MATSLLQSAAGSSLLGKTVDHITVDDLAPVDEFHIGGRQASEDFLRQLDLKPKNMFLMSDVALGAARFVADRYGCHVSGIDLTPEYVETARVLWVGRTDRPHLTASRQCACDAFCRSHFRW